MHRHHLLLVGLILFATGCGQSQKLEEAHAEITKLKSEQQKLVAEQESQLTKQKEQAKKDLEAAQGETQKAAVEQLKKLEADSLGAQKERDAAKQEVQRLDAKSREIQTQLTAKMQDHATAASDLQKLTATKSKLDQDLSKAKKDLDALQSDFKKELDTVTAEKTAAKKDVEALKTQVADLRKQVGQLKTDPRILTKLDDFKDAIENTGIIGFKPGKHEEVRALMKALGFSEEDLDLKRNSLVCQWKKPLTEEDLKMIEAFRSVIISFEPNRPLKKNSLEGSDAKGASLLPNSDSSLQRPSNYYRAAYLKDRWGLNNIHAPDAWKTLSRVTPEKPIVVAVIDSGVDYRHPDLKQQMWTNENEIPGNNIDDDRNGYVDDYYGVAINVKGKQIRDQDVRPTKEFIDDYPHGTHCAGIVLSVGLLGNDPALSGTRVRIMALRYEGSMRSAAECIDYAVEHGATIISFSTALADERPSRELESAIESAISKDKGVIFVCPAGNAEHKTKPLNTDSTNVIPACYGHITKTKRYDDYDGDKFPVIVSANFDSIISVASVNHDSNLSSFSNYGENTIDIAAPGGELEDLANPAEVTFLSKYSKQVGVLSTIPIDLATRQWGTLPIHYAPMHGTSQAVPYVAGAAAIIWSHPKYKKYSAAQIKELLLEKVLKKTNLAGKCRTGGMLNLAFLSETSVPVDQHLTAVVKAPNRQTFSKQFWSGMNDLKHNDFAAALANFEAAMKKEPANPAYHYFAAFAWAGLKDDQRADQVFAKALELETRHPLGKHWGELMEGYQGPHRGHIEDIRRDYLNGKSFKSGPIELVSTSQSVGAWQFWRQWRDAQIASIASNRTPPQSDPMNWQSSITNTHQPFAIDEQVLLMFPGGRAVNCFCY